MGSKGENGTIPVGEYSVQIVESMTITDPITGIFRAQFGYVVLDGEYAGERLSSRHILMVPTGSAIGVRRAEYIGYQTFRELSFACGVDFASDTEQLHFKPHIVRVAFLAARPARAAGERDNLGRFLPAQCEIREAKNVIRRWLTPAGEARPFGTPPFSDSY